MFQLYTEVHTHKVASKIEKFKELIGTKQRHLL